MDRKTVKLWCFLTFISNIVYFSIIPPHIHSFIYLPTHHSFIHLFTHSFTHLFIHFADNIEANVEIAATRVESGNKQLGRAVKHKVRRYVKILIYLSSSFVSCHLFWFPSLSLNFALSFLFFLMILSLSLSLSLSSLLFSLLSFLFLIAEVQ